MKATISPVSKLHIKASRSSDTPAQQLDWNRARLELRAEELIAAVLLDHSS
jgi:hypothetical protein